MAVELPPKDEDDGMVSASPCVARGVRSVRSEAEDVDLTLKDELVFAATAKI
jgi:hypothetical protein